MRKIFLFSIILVLFVSCGKVKKPNVLIITIDALRADHLSLYGYKYKTSPNIDEFAKKSWVYKNAFCAIPKTSASIASMLTGLHPTVLHIRPNLGTLRSNFLTLAEALEKKGYITGASVFNGNLDRAFGFAQGFQRYDEVWKRNNDDKEGSDEFITQWGINFIKENSDEPFFLWLHYIDTHAPYLPSQRWIKSREQGVDIRKIEPKLVVGAGKWVHLNKHPYLGFYIERYDGEVRKADYYVGEVLKFLEEKKLLENTIVIISSDHGEELGEHHLFFDHGPLPFNSSIRIPMIVHYPGMEKHRVIEEAVSLMDITPTIADIVGLKFPYKLTGISMLKPVARRKLLILGLKGHAIIDFPLKGIFLSEKAEEQLGLKHFYAFEIQRDPEEISPLEISKYKFSLLRREMNDLLFNYIKRGKKFKKIGRKRKISRKTLQNLKSLGYVK